MNNPNVLNISQPNKFAVMAASGTMAVAGMLGFGAGKAEARVMEVSDITCTTVDPVNPGADPCVGNIGNRLITHEASDYPAVDAYSKRTLYIRPNGIRTALYSLDVDNQDVAGTLTPADTKDDVKRIVTWAANGSVLDCQVLPYNGNQADECGPYDLANGTTGIPMSDELTIGTTPTPPNPTNPEPTPPTPTNPTPTTPTPPNPNPTNPTPTNPSPVEPNWSLIETCLNKDADLSTGTKFTKVKFLTQRLGLVQASFKTLEQKDSACAGIDTNRTVRFRILQKRPDGKERAVTQWPLLVKNSTDNGRLRTVKAFAGTGTPLCGPKYPYRVVATAKTYADIKDGTETVRATNTTSKSVTTRKFVKPCAAKKSA